MRAMTTPVEPIISKPFRWADQARPILALSPMADMTDSPFCLVAKERGAKIMFREMVSAEAVVRGNEKTLGMTAFDERERPLIQQIFGAEPHTMAEAARIIEEKYHPDGIDINMGCPVYKIVHNFNGACLMKDHVRAAAIIRAMKAVITVPLSVKIRLGWSRPDEALTFIQHLEAAGADLVTVHGRTKEQGYSGKSDWEMIGRVVKQVQIPVLANGDVHQPEQVPQILDVTGAAGVLIARGALGNPWFFQHAEEVLATGSIQTPVSLRERLTTMLQHAQLHIEHYGERGIVTFRKHISWYLKGLVNIKPFREQAMKVQSLDELVALTAHFLTTVVE